MDLFTVSDARSSHLGEFNKGDACFPATKRISDSSKMQVCGNLRLPLNVKAKDKTCKSRLSIFTHVGTKSSVLHFYLFGYYFKKSLDIDGS